MKETTFRGIRKDNGEWAYGYFFQSWERTYILWGTTNDNPNMIEVIPETVGQYTGLKDKNDVEIYEGDIVNWKGMEYGDTQAYGKDLIDVVGEIRCEYGSNEWVRNSIDQCVVIGNVHEHPQLLEKK